MDSSYRTSPAQTILGHFPGRLLYVRDAVEGHGGQDDSLWLAARVRSGDYLTTVATELDRVVQALSSGIAGPAIVLPEIERLVNELLEVGKSYKVVPRR